MNILTTGITGMVGQHLQTLWGEHIHINDARQSGVDITDSEAVEAWVSQSDAQVILHMAAKTDVDGCEEDKLLGEEGEAWQINVVGTEHIIAAAQKHNKRCIYLSTDFVFDGTKDRYTEEDETNPICWYARTKEEGEIRVKDATCPWTIVRIAYPYGSRYGGKKDFVLRILDILKQKGTISAVTDHVITPTYLDDIAHGLAVLIEKPYDGIYHVVGSTSLTVKDAVDRIATCWKISGTIIPTTRDIFFHTRAFRPRSLVLSHDKIAELGVSTRSFDEGIVSLKHHLTGDI